MRHARSQLGFYRLLPGGSRGARLIELADVKAIVVPACPWLSIVNCVFSYGDADALELALPELAQEYERDGIRAWGIWAATDDAACAAVLRSAGFEAGSEILKMGGYIEARNVAPRRELDLVADASWEHLAACNDRAYRLPRGLSVQPAFELIDDPTVRVYAARHDDAIVSSLVAREADGDCYLAFVATVPEAQGHGAGGELVRHALRSASTRGCVSGSGESTPAGVKLYTAVGGGLLGRFALWSRP